MNNIALILRRQNPCSDKSVRGEYRRGGFRVVRQSAALSLIQAIM